MSDIFISYAREDWDKAKALAELCQQQDWSVWWDRRIPPGRSFDEVIEEALGAAKCVVVLWSKSSASSDWVKGEAAEGLRRKILVPVRIDSANVTAAISGKRKLLDQYGVSLQTDQNVTN
jgi:TIR domain